MGRVWLAFKVFFDVLFDASRAEQIRTIEASPPTPPVEAPVAQPEKPAPAKPQPAGRSDAITLLETLQREARLIDFLQEDLDSYSDQQVGSAVREVHRGSRAVLKRLFSIQPVVTQAEGSPFTLQGTEEAARVRLIGKVVETRPVTGTLVHSGWRVERCDLPQWMGSQDAKLIVAPAEVEL